MKGTFSKIISVFLLCIVCGSAMLSTACTAEESLRIASNIVWKYDNENTERTVYTVTRFNSKSNVIASGVFTSTVSYNDESSMFILDTDFQLQYSEERTDTITSRSVFTRAGLKPVYSQKKRVIKGEIPYDGAYTLTALDSYEYEAVYTDFTLNGTGYKKGAKGTFYRATNPTITMDMSHSSPEFYCDNEYMFYFIRSVHDFGLGYSKQFSLVDLFRSFAQDKPSLMVNSINLSVAAEEVPLTLSGSIVSESGGGLMLKGEMSGTNTTGTVNALQTTISLNSTNTGSSITAYYSAPIQGTTEAFANNRLVLLGFDTEEVTGVNFSPALYKMQFRLTNLYNTVA